jgi:type IV pilus assembly protein PilC
MPTDLSYRYTALDSGGKTVRGTETANSVSSAHLALLQRGLEPIEIDEKKKVLQFEITKKSVKRKEIMHFSRQLSVFVEAGIPIMEALEILSEESGDKLMTGVVRDMVSRLQSGDTFATAAAAHPEAFPRYYIAVLESAELTGTLDLVLRELAEYIERDMDARSQIISALIYPGVVFCMAIVTVVVLATFVLPKFTVFFGSLHAKLPLPTRMLLSASAFVQKWWWAIAVCMALIAVMVVVVRRSSSGRARLDALVLKVPVAGSVVQAAVVERVCRVLSSLVMAGVDMPRAIAVAAESASNAVYSRGLTVVREQMMEGNGLSQPISESGLFPGAAQQMFRIGEETGTLDKQLETAASYYHRELELKLKHFTSLFEPAIIIFMGLIVGFVAVALVSAMYGIYNQVSAG